MLVIDVFIVNVALSRGPNGPGCLAAEIEAVVGSIWLLCNACRNGRSSRRHLWSEADLLRRRWRGGSLNLPPA
jgi:hypothetical protein